MKVINNHWIDRDIQAWWYQSRRKISWFFHTYSIFKTWRNFLLPNPNLKKQFIDWNIRTLTILTRRLILLDYTSLIHFSPPFEVRALIGHIDTIIEDIIHIGLVIHTDCILSKLLQDSCIQFDNQIDHILQYTTWLLRRCLQKCLLTSLG